MDGAPAAVPPHPVELDSPVYRWPGGNFVSGCDGKDRVGEQVAHLPLEKYVEKHRAVLSSRCRCAEAVLPSARAVLDSDTPRAPIHVGPPYAGHPREP